VVLPSKPLCCGRALYDWGMLDRAKGLLADIVDTLRPEIEAGTPVVGLEPACVSAFRDELPALFPDDGLAARLSRQTVMFSEFLRDRDLPDIRPLGRKAVVQLHCHHHAVLDPSAEWALLDRLGLEVVARPSGCCGMAGSLGFERGRKQAVSAAAAARALRPALDAAGEDTIVVANGFSCREQIRHVGQCRSFHSAELAQSATAGRGTGSAENA
jgi:Fe-S oxidoreductase